MLKEARNLLKCLKLAKTEEERITVLDSTLSCLKQNTEEWWHWGLTDLVREVLKYYSKHKPETFVCKHYIEQFIFYLGNLYLDLPKEQRSLDMFSSLLHASLVFGDYGGDSKYLFKRIFTDERFLMDWLVNDESELETKFMIVEHRSDKFILLKSIIEGELDRPDNGGSGKSLSIYSAISNIQREFGLFVGIKKRLDELIRAAECGLSKDDFKWLVKDGHTKYLYRTEHSYYAGKYHGAPDDMKPVTGWMHLLDADNPAEIAWCIKYPMKDVVAKNELRLDKHLLGKIFRFKQCQSLLYNHPAYSYAIPDMIEYAKGRTNHNSLCVEFKDILGYLDEE